MLSPVGAENCARRHRNPRINRHYANWLWRDWMNVNSPSPCGAGGVFKRRIWIPLPVTEEGLERQTHQNHRHGLGGAVAAIQSIIKKERYFVDR